MLLSRPKSSVPDPWHFYTAPDPWIRTLDLLFRILLFRAVSFKMPKKIIFLLISFCRSVGTLTSVFKDKMSLRGPKTQNSRNHGLS
jgi:hypothetical protein